MVMTLINQLIPHKDISGSPAGSAVDQRPYNRADEMKEVARSCESHGLVDTTLNQKAIFCAKTTARFVQYVHS